MLVYLCKYTVTGLCGAFIVTYAVLRVQTGSVHYQQLDHLEPVDSYSVVHRRVSVLRNKTGRLWVGGGKGADQLEHVPCDHFVLLHIESCWILSDIKCLSLLIAVLTLSLALTSAPQWISCSAHSQCPVLTATWRGVLRSWGVENGKEEENIGEGAGHERKVEVRTRWGENVRQQREERRDRVNYKLASK